MSCACLLNGAPWVWIRVRVISAGRTPLHLPLHGMADTLGHVEAIAGAR